MKRFSFALLLAWLLTSVSSPRAHGQNVELIPAPAAAPSAQACPPACSHACPATCKECIAVPTTKAKTKVVYGCKTVEYCKLGCLFNLFHGRHSGCGADCEGGCAKCGKVRTKNVLLKKVVPDGDQHGHKCVVVERPACEAPCHHVAPLPANPAVVRPMPLAPASYSKGR